MTLNKKQRKFCENVAKGLAPYQACLKAGYKPSYAKNFSHKLLEKYGNEIDKIKPKVKKIIEKKFNYDVETSFKKLCEIQELALLPDEKGNYGNLSSAIKAEELKGKMYGVYERDNTQKAGINIVVSDKKHKEMLEEL